MNIDIQGIGRAVQVAEKSQVELEKLKKATDGFEAIFLKKLFSQMRSSVKETQFGQTFGKEIYNDMFDEAMANSAANSKTLGLGDMLYKQFSPRIVEGVAQSQRRARAAAKLDVEAGAVPGSQDLRGRGAADFKAGRHDLEGPGTHRLEANATSRGHDLAGRETHGQAAHATRDFKTEKHDLAGRATREQAAHANSQRKS